jgi:hypothetical protein
MTPEELFEMVKRQYAEETKHLTDEEIMRRCRERFGIKS